VYDTSCINGETTTGRLSDLVSADEIAQLDDWMMSLGQVSIDASDPPMVADRMVVTLTLMGTGSRRTVSDPTKQELLEFAQSLHGELNKK